MMCVYMCVHVCVHMCVCVCAYVCLCLWQLRKKFNFVYVAINVAPHGTLVLTHIHFCGPVGRRYEKSVSTTCKNVDNYGWPISLARFIKAASIAQNGIWKIPIIFVCFFVEIDLFEKACVILFYLWGNE